MMNFDYNKLELVYYTVNQRDMKLIEVAKYCKENKYRFVLIIPTTQKYSYHINECFNILRDDFLLYEISMGMGVVLKARTEKYTQYIEKSELYENHII